MKTTNRTATAPAIIATMQDVYNLTKYMQNVLGPAYHPEDPVKDYIFIDEQGNTRPSFSANIAARLQNLIDQAAELCASVGVDLCAVRCSNAIAAVKGYDLDQLNAEFSELLNTHAEDTEVNGASRQQFAEVTEEESDPAVISHWATACNAWDELCNRHEGLTESGLNWFAGGSFVGYPNPWDLYIGDGGEPYLF